jgi:hypothetical protein
LRLSSTASKRRSTPTTFSSARCWYRPVGLEAEPLGGGLDDSEVRLVRHEPLDVGARDAGSFERDRTRLRYGAHRAAKHFLTLHLHVVAARRDRVG